MSKVNKNYNQVCVWHGTTVGDKTKQKEFVDFMKSDFGVRAKYLEEITTMPDKGDDEGKTGGRIDLFFAVHKNDVPKFAVPRLEYGIRWIQDVYDNGGFVLYEESERIKSEYMDLSESA